MEEVASGWFSTQPTGYSVFDRERRKSPNGVQVIWPVEMRQEGVGRGWGRGQGPLYREACLPG